MEGEVDAGHSRLVVEATRLGVLWHRAGTGYVPVEIAEGLRRAVQQAISELSPQALDWYVRSAGWNERTGKPPRTAALDALTQAAHAYARDARQRLRDEEQAGALRLAEEARAARVATAARADARRFLELVQGAPSWYEPGVQQVQREMRRLVAELPDDPVVKQLGVELWELQELAEREKERAQLEQERLEFERAAAEEAEEAEAAAEQERLEFERAAAEEAEEAEAAAEQERLELERRARWLSRPAPAPPPLPYGVSHEGAESLVCDWMRHLGVTDAAVTRFVADGGIDVESSAYVAQVKNFAGSVPVDAVRALYGVAQADRKQGLFFTSGTLTVEALAFATRVGIACFVYSAVEGTLRGANELGATAVEHSIAHAYSEVPGSVVE